MAVKTERVDETCDVDGSWCMYEGKLSKSYGMIWTTLPRWIDIWPRTELRFWEPLLRQRDPECSNFEHSLTSTYWPQSAPASFAWQCHLNQYINNYNNNNKQIWYNNMSVGRMNMFLEIHPPLLWVFGS